MSTRRSGPSWRHFYPRSPCGERPLSSAMSRWACLFLSTLSLRRATLLTGYCPVHDIDFYPRSPCGERPACQGPPLRGICISIHALLAESDAPQQENGQAATISIHALLAESDSLSSSSWGFMLISIHALLAESDVNSDYYGRLCYEISIHALLAESDWQKYDLNKDCLDFYPRSPCGERHVGAPLYRLR